MGNLWRCNAVVGGLLISGAMAGCVVGSEEPTEEGPHLGQVRQHIDEEFNGRAVIGEALEGDAYMNAIPGEYFSVSTTAMRPNGASTVITFTGGASLRGAFLNPDLVGLVLSSGSVRLRITSVSPPTPTPAGPVTHYGLEASVNGQPYSRACDDAVPLAGVITREGEHRPSPTSGPRITLMCKDGAGAKCVRFGYPAGIPGSQFYGVHQACMQMVRADYCATGVPNTRVGTSIEFYDNAGVYQVAPGTQLPIMTVASWPPGPDEYYFEAAFRATHTAALCNARARWPLITSNCIAAIPDCPYDTVDHLINPGGAMLFVASQYNQLRLDRWRSNHGTGADRVSTVRGYFNQGDMQMMAPWDGYAHEGTDGMLLRIPPASVPLASLVSVSLFRRAGGDAFVARSDDPRFALTATFGNLGWEGYVYKYESDVLNGRALRLYHNAATDDFTATTAPQANIEAEGYLPYPGVATDDNLIGYMATF